MHTVTFTFDELRTLIFGMDGYRIDMERERTRMSHREDIETADLILSWIESAQHKLNEVAPDNIDMDLPVLGLERT